MENFLFLTFNGISIGSILLLVALGLAFSFGLMRVINMAHGEFILIGAYTTYFCQTFLAEALRGPDGAKEGLVFLLSIVIAFFVAGFFGFLLEKFVIRHLYGRPLDTLLATWGIGLIIQQIARSYDSRNLPVTSPQWLNGALQVSDGLFLPYKRLFIIGLSIACLVAVYLYLFRTVQGRRTRAVMQNREVAATMGISTRLVDGLTFALGSGLAGVAGSALTLLGQIGPQLGTGYIVDAFMVVVLGGVGSLPGAVLAAFVIGMFNSYFEFYTTATLGKVLVFALIIIFLQWKPQGLVGVRSRA
ncbi:MAG: urea ABC transporter permease subunit UrtB [Anaerolineae bacterium]|nr:urea ABC transporter permease subunit UrtB [Anaerolineae bacterium]